MIGLESLQFKVECWQPTGSWLDRSAVTIVEAAIAEGRTGLCTIGIEPWTVPLAIRCVQTGLRCVVLEPAEADAAESAERGWLTALGARTLVISAGHQLLRSQAPAAVAGAGLGLVSPDDPLLQAGLASVVHEVGLAGGADAVLAVPNVAGWEHAWLSATALMRRRLAVVGRLTEQDGANACPDDSFVLSVGISPREADAARRLLAHEEGLLVSRRGATGLAGLVRALREDRAKRPRERRLREVRGAVVVLTGDPLRADDGPPEQADAIATRSVALSELSSGLARLLIEPPGRQADDGTAT